VVAAYRNTGRVNLCIVGVTEVNAFAVRFPSCGNIAAHGIGTSAKGTPCATHWSGWQKYLMEGNCEVKCEWSMHFNFLLMGYVPILILTQSLM
jgi:hypothetical protein